MKTKEERKAVYFTGNVTEDEKKKIKKFVEDFRLIGKGKVQVGDVIGSILLAAAKTENQEFIKEVRDILTGE